MRDILLPILQKYTIHPVTPDALLEDIRVHTILPAIAADLDEAFGIEIPDVEVNRWESVADIVGTVDRMTQARAA